MNIRTHIATDGLKKMIEGNFGMPVEMTAPDGTEIKVNEKGEVLMGEVLYDRDEIDPETGNLATANETTVTLRRSALSRIPVAGEKWKISIPPDPANPTVMKTFLINNDKAPIDGGSIGFIKLFLKEVEQS